MEISGLFCFFVPLLCGKSLSSMSPNVSQVHYSAKQVIDPDKISSLLEESVRAAALKLSRKEYFQLENLPPKFDSLCVSDLSSFSG